ncbi:MAG: DNA-processing protein DprA, partial [Alphaproteobacteria bacterium]|nr:DNA-processing protein DprA [Alphaproteobacteria bacterium]
MTHAERLARLRLIRTSHVGPVSWHQLMQRFGSGEAALEALPDLVLRGGAGKARIAPVELAERELERAAALGARHIFSDEPDYSAMLREVEGAPPVVVVRGDTAMLRRPCVAMVGARNASAIACRFARQLAGDLAARDVTVVSGLARGVDTAAHIGALGGSTVGVIASGIDIAFPPENAALQEKIATDQLLIAEQ